MRRWNCRGSSGPSARAQAASARFVVQRQSDGGLAFTDIDARGAGLTAQGRARLARDNTRAGSRT